MSSSDQNQRWENENKAPIEIQSGNVILKCSTVKMNWLAEEEPTNKKNCSQLRV